MTSKSHQQQTPPTDYKLLIPRDWFRVDLTQERWRPQIKTFLDQHADVVELPTDVRQSLWLSLCAHAEAGLANGAVEFYLTSQTGTDSVLPASLLVSLVPSRGGLSVSPADLAAALRERHGTAADVSTVELPAGEAVRLVQGNGVDVYVRMPGEVGYLMLAFSVVLDGASSAMANLCDAISQSLRWVY